MRQDVINRTGSPPVGVNYWKAAALSIALLSTGAAIVLIASSMGRDYPPVAQPTTTAPAPFGHDLQRQIDRLQDQIASQQTITELRVALARERARLDNSSELAALQQQIAALRDKRPSYQLDVIKVGADPRYEIAPPNVSPHLQKYIAAVLGN